MSKNAKILALIGVAVLLIGTLLLGVAALGTKIWNETPAEKAAVVQQDIKQMAQWKAMEQQLATTHVGDIIELDRGLFAVITYIVPRESNIEWSEINICRMGWQCAGSNNTVGNVARYTKKVIKKTEPPTEEYKMAAVKVVNQ